MNPENFACWSGMRENLLVVSKILAFGIWITVRGIQNPTNDWNQKPVPGIRGVNGIRQNRPFIKMASRLKFSFSVAE